MKRIIIFLIALFISIAAVAKTDYKNPVESQYIGTLIIQPTQYKEVQREMFLCTDKYDNRYININVNYFVNKGKDKLEITLNNDMCFTLELGKSFKQHAYNFFSIDKYANINKLGYYQFFSAYPITKEQLELIRESGIKEIRVEGIYNITYKPLE